MYEDVTAADMRTRDLGVLVGFDGSDHARSALQFGASEALRRKTTLTVVTAYAVPVPIYPNMASLPSEPEDRARRKNAEATLDVAEKYLDDYAGDLILAVAEGNPTGTLADLSKQAQLVVVGARGRGGFIGQLLGSVAAALPAHAHCPTIVFPGTDSTEADAKNEKFVEQKPGGPIVAAIDGSAQSAEVLTQAAQVAEETSASSQHPHDHAAGGGMAVLVPRRSAPERFEPEAQERSREDDQSRPLVAFRRSPESGDLDRCRKRPGDRRHH